MAKIDQNNLIVFHADNPNDYSMGLEHVHLKNTKVTSSRIRHEVTVAAHGRLPRQLLSGSSLFFISCNFITLSKMQRSCLSYLWSGSRNCSSIACLGGWWFILVTNVTIWSTTQWSQPRWLDGFDEFDDGFESELAGTGCDDELSGFRNVPNPPIVYTSILEKGVEYDREIHCGSRWKLGQQACTPGCGRTMLWPGSHR